MITFNNKHYAKNNDEFTNSLFTSGGTCNGFYKEANRGIYIYNIQNELIAFIRLHNEPMVMSAAIQPNGKKWYSYTNAETERYLGIRGLDNQRIISFSDERNAIENIIRK
jgi:hypothetical protein